MSPADPAEFRRAVVVETLRRCPLFAGLPPTELQQVADTCSLRKYEKGDHLFHEGQVTEGFYVIQQGAVAIYRLGPAGREQIIHTFRAGDSFAEATLTMPEGAPANARAVVSTQAVLVRRGSFLELIRRQPALALRLIGSLSQRMRLLVGQIEDLTPKDVETRLMHWLVKRCPQPDGLEPYEVAIPGTKRQLAAELGTVSETFSRTLARLREMELIRSHSRSIVVLCPATLHKALQQRLRG